MAVAKWTVWVEARQPNGSAERVEIGAVERDLSSPGPDDLGLRLARATPEFIRVQAEVGACLSFREAARVMNLLLPAGKATNHTGVHRRLARTAERLQTLDGSSLNRMSRAKGGPMLVSLDSARIRAMPGFQVRHLEVTARQVETGQRPARHFAVAPNVQATRPGTIGNALRAQGWLPGRDVVVLSLPKASAQLLAVR